MPDEEEYERRPKMKMIFVGDPKGMKTEEGFKSIKENDKGKMEASYVNIARVQFEHPEPIRPLDAQGNLVRGGAYGAWYMWRVTDYDHGHKLVVFFSENRIEAEDTKEVTFKEPFVVRDIQAHIRETGLTEENWKKFLFQLGKTHAKQGGQGKWYCRLISTTADTPGLFDDPKSDRFLDAFELRPEEEGIIQKINKLVDKNGVPETFTKEMFLTTFTSGAAGPPSTQKRAMAIWDLAKTEPDRVKLHPDLVKFIKTKEPT